jgi:hypothetical protein
MTVNGYAQDEVPQKHPKTISGHGIGKVEAASGWEKTST